MKNVNKCPSHETSKEEYESNPQIRKIDGFIKDEVKMLLKVNGDKKLIKRHIETLMEKKVVMKDIHNIGLQLKK